MSIISIIVPVYNVESYLRRSMDCLLNQTMQELEFICIDDCSTDGSLSILREYEAKDNRFKIIALDKNCGAAVARNKGLEVATGEYLGFIDPDDEIDLNYYEELYKKAKEGDYDIVKCRRMDISANGKRKLNSDSENIKKHGIYGFSYEWTCAIYKAAIIYDNNIRFREDIIKAQDTLFLNEVVLKSNTIALTDNVFYYYYLREGSLNSVKLSKKKLESAVLAVKSTLHNVNNADVFKNGNKEQYDYLYSRRFNPFVELFYKCMDKESQLLCAKEMVEGFHICRDKEALAKSYRYKQLLPFIENNFK